MHLEHLLNKWKEDIDIFPNFAYWHLSPKHKARYRDYSFDIATPVRQSLSSKGINKLYKHQVRAIELIDQKKNIILTTGTASGKSLCYQIPIINSIITNADSSALLIYPTKALSRDQAKYFVELIESPHINQAISNQDVGIYDGDTPLTARAHIRNSSRIVLTNPDMLHQSILPNHISWNRIFMNLRFIVIDEIHIYRGIFGSHVANVIRRLKRLANIHGSNPQFILTSSTIANPTEHAKNLIGEDVCQVAEDTSPKGNKFFLIYNPPIIDSRFGLRKSAFSEATKITSDLIDNDIQTVMFGRSRRSIELLLTQLNDTIKLSNKKSAQLHGYRSGYLPSHRRKIENKLKTGELSAVVATNALELGMDIGELSAVVMVGFPGTVASTRQQAGRAGRNFESSCAILILSADPLDQFIAKHPEYIISNAPEYALVNPDNLFILLNHLKCAAHEHPFSSRDTYGNLNQSQMKEIFNILVSQGYLYHSQEKYFWINQEYPAQNISLRNITGETIDLLSKGETAFETIGQIDQKSAYSMVYPGAVYLHDGVSYLVDELKLNENSAILTRTKVEYYTTPVHHDSIEVKKIIDKRRVNKKEFSYHVFLGEILVTDKVVGFKKISTLTNQIIGDSPLELPTTELWTTSYWMGFNPESIDFLRARGDWNNDPNQYGKNWKQQRDLARKRDSYRCQLCGKLETERTHDVHHKIPYKFFSNHIEANTLENLVTLCHNCHQRVEVSVRIRSGMTGLAYILGKLAPFFLMCDTHDLGTYINPKYSIADSQLTLAIFENFQGGFGLSERIYSLHQDLINASVEMISQCPCLDGCPSCVGPGGEFGSGSKRATLGILQALSTD